MSLVFGYAIGIASQSGGTGVSETETRLQEIVDATIIPAITESQFASGKEHP